MIIGNIEDLNSIKGLNKNIDTVIDYIKNNNLCELKIGTHKVDDESVYLVKENYKTKELDRCLLKSNKKYINLDVILKGQEIIGYINAKSCEEDTSYKVKDGVIKYKGNVVTCIYEMRANSYALTFPEDAVISGIILSEITEVEKVTFKIEI